MMNKCRLNQLELESTINRIRQMEYYFDFVQNCGGGQSGVSAQSGALPLRAGRAGHYDHAGGTGGPQIEV